jgi:predicted phage terminase large subunit-like protein
MDAPLSERERLKLQVIGRALLPLAEQRAELEDSLISFVEAAWPSLDPSPYQPSWAMDAVCEHLEAVTNGQIRKLLINLSPRCGKTLVTSVCFPAWVWAQRDVSYLRGPQVRFLCGSYNDDLSLQSATRHRRLLLSPWYQRYWGRRFRLTPDQAAKSRFDCTAGGSRISTSARGLLLGIGGDCIIVDDPHNLHGAESEAERLQALNWWRELSSTRLNDPKRSALVVLMQRVHECDVSGHILSSDGSEEWCHLMVPAEYEWRRHCVTVLGWRDPRGLDENSEPLVTVLPSGERVPRDAEAANELDRRDGTLMWPERFGPGEIARIKAELGPYLASGRLQQSPMPAKGGIFQRDWWQLYESPDNKFPAFDHLVASLDSAFTEKEQNDPSGLTVWGVYSVEGKRRIMLVHAWRKHLPFSGPRIDKGTMETLASYKRRTSSTWGLIEWVADTCTRFNVDRLLIEAKASGISAAQELRNRYAGRSWAIDLRQVKGDKLSRALAVQPIFTQGMIYAPARDWSELVITEMSMFPVGRYKDLTDSASMALKYLRDVGLADTEVEEQADKTERAMRRLERPKPLYPGCW